MTPAARPLVLIGMLSRVKAGRERAVKSDWGYQMTNLEQGNRKIAAALR